MRPYVFRDFPESLTQAQDIVLCLRSCAFCYPMWQAALWTASQLSPSSALVLPGVSQPHTPALCLPFSSVILESCSVCCLVPSKSLLDRVESGPFLQFPSMQVLSMGFLLILQTDLSLLGNPVVVAFHHWCSLLNRSLAFKSSLSNSKLENAGSMGWDSQGRLLSPPLLFYFVLRGIISCKLGWPQIKLLRYIG